MSQYLDSLPVRLQLIFLLLVLLIFCAVIHTNDGIIEGNSHDDDRILGVILSWLNVSIEAVLLPDFYHLFTIGKSQA